MRDGRVALDVIFSVLHAWLVSDLLLADTPAELSIFAAPLRVFSFPGVASYSFRRSQYHASSKCVIPSYHIRK
jgi:hypothetical protein